MINKFQDSKIQKFQDSKIQRYCLFPIKNNFSSLRDCYILAKPQSRRIFHGIGNNMLWIAHIVYIVL